MFSSPASANDLKTMMGPSLSRSSSNPESSLLTLPENIEVEKKVELLDMEALLAFEKKILDAGGRLLDETRFTDCYYDSSDLLLTRSNHYLRDRNGIWELKVPCYESSTATSVYEELEGVEQIVHYFSNRFIHGKVDLPFPHEVISTDSDDLQPLQKKTPRFEMTPFVEFTTKRRRWQLLARDHMFSIDVDEASFGCYLAEFELMVHSHAHVDDALSCIDIVCQDLGVVGAPNQDRASKFVNFILRDEKLLCRTEKFAPAVLKEN
mmetsp:Transcript_50875/g.65145  ORF Transcript_50875/g.65145 Transcript_50875/m.65145 type:complete len:265 (-) Transcript_50875:111-905(-)